MGAKANPNRRLDIEKMLKKAKPKEMLSLEDLAFVWGTTKGPFVTAKKMMAGFPQPTLQGTQHIYPARAALQAMLDYEMRNDAAAAARQRRQSAILGGLQRQRMEEATDSGLSPRDLQILNRIAAETEQRERDQREYIPAAEVAMVAGEVFSALSEFMAGLSNKIDPNGLLAATVRTAVDDHARDALLGFHKQMKQILDADAIGGPTGEAPRSARRAPTRRKRA